MKDTSNCIETENKKIEEQNNPHFWLSVETDSRKVYAHKLTKAKYRNEMVKITCQQAVIEYNKGTAFTKQALNKFERSEEDFKEIREILLEASGVFLEYALIHNQKGNNDKSTRNNILSEKQDRALKMIRKIYQERFLQKLERKNEDKF